MKTIFILILILTLTESSFSQLNEFSEHIITTNAQQAYGVFAADIDGDGDMDVLSASFNDNKIAWYENTDGLGNFGSQQVITTNANGAISVFATDIDNDGDIDVLSASYNDDKIAWYENTDGQGSFGPQQIISSNLVKPTTIYAADLDLDGDMDVISASTQHNKVVWYRNLDGQGNFSLEIIIAQSSTQNPWTVYASDLDGDGDMDVLSGSRDDNQVAWFENQHPLDSIGPQRLISSSALGVNQVVTGDIDGDGDMDVLSANLNESRIRWWENTDGQGNFLLHFIPQVILGPWSLATGDIDLDGDLDIVFSSLGNDEIAWYENQDGQGTFHIQKHLISINANEATSVYVSDIDGDGSIDVLSASRLDNKIAWYENLRVLNVNDLTQTYFTVSPIPSSSVIYINSKYPVALIEIYNEVGQLLISESNQNKVNISTLSQGLYFIKIIDINGNIGTKKITRE